MRRAALLVATALVTLACGVHVAVESEPGARPSSWKSWSWLQRPAVPRGDTELATIDQTVRQSFEREMKTRGFREVERERPDFLVTYYAAVDHPIDPKALDYAAGGWAAARASVNDAGVYEQGLLIVDLLDASTGRLVWRGAGRGVFTAKQTPQEREERIADAVHAVVSELASR